MNCFELRHTLESILLPIPVDPKTVVKGEVLCFRRYNEWRAVASAERCWKVRVNRKGSREYQCWHFDESVWQHVYRPDQLQSLMMAYAVIEDRIREIKRRGFIVESDFGGPPDFMGPMWKARGTDK